VIEKKGIHCMIKSQPGQSKKFWTARGWKCHWWLQACGAQRLKEEVDGGVVLWIQGSESIKKQQMVRVRLRVKVRVRVRVAVRVKVRVIIPGSPLSACPVDPRERGHPSFNPALRRLAAATLGVQVWNRKANSASKQGKADLLNKAFPSGGKYRILQPSFERKPATFGSPTTNPHNSLMCDLEGGSLPMPGGLESLHSNFVTQK